MKIISHLKQSLKSFVSPEKICCIICDDEIYDINRYSVCNKCHLPLNTEYCNCCGSPTSNLAPICNDCQNYPNYYVQARSSFVFQDPMQAAVYRFKYGGEKYLAKYLAEFMVDTLVMWGIDFDVITYVPLHHKRQSLRQYNQSQLLAEHIAVTLDNKVEPLLVKNKHTQNLTRMSREDRQKIVKDTFTHVSNNKYNCVLLIDDVMTSGATVNECAKVLVKSGVKEVYVLTLCSGRKYAPTMHTSDITNLSKLF